MSDWREFTGKTVDDALTNALVELETTSDKVEYEVLEEGSSGRMFLLFVYKQCRLEILLRYRFCFILEGSKYRYRKLKI